MKRRTHRRAAHDALITFTIALFLLLLFLPPLLRCCATAINHL